MLGEAESGPAASHQDSLQYEIDSFVKWIFQHYGTDDSPRGGKVIHDGVWGTNRYEPFEVALINTPLVQRLRQINQTAFTYLTYPSSRHTRFEHTLGVVTQVSKLLSSLDNKFKYSTSVKKQLLGETLTRSLRCAALLHDVGHGPASHTSEEIYKEYTEIKDSKRSAPWKSANAHEILAYLIINSQNFEAFLSRAKRSCPADIDFELVKHAIVGHHQSGDNYYKIDVMNGPFDADKLDYLFRDGHFSGLPLTVDLDRLWYALDINYISDNQRLTIDWGGTSSLEQILFSKMTLFPAVYHHHKVRASDCMFKGIVEYIQEKHVPIGTLVPNMEGSLGDAEAFSRASHFLYFTDADIFNLDQRLCGDGPLHDLVHNLEFRRLLKRAVVVSRDTVMDKTTIDDFVKWAEEPNEFRDAAKAIWEESGKPGMLQEIWVDCPKDPNFDSVNDTWISPLGHGQEPLRLRDFFSAEQYANQYKHHKWRGHVFCRPEHVQSVARACVKVFGERYGIKFKPLAFHLCHVDAPT